jgi:ABC-type nitrate/sulfonate/bicarbonate transport system substrate-binding protein
MSARATFAASLWLAAASAAAAPLPVRVAWTTVPAEMTPVLFRATPLLAHRGASYVVEPVHFADSPPMLRALAAGEIDLIPLAPATFAVAIENAGMEDLRIVAADYEDGVAGAFSSPFMVRSDGPVRTIADLKGGVLAVNAFGALGDVALHAMLARHGLEDGRDYRVVVTPYPSMGAMLEDGRIALAALVAPFAQRLEMRGTARTLFDRRAAIGPSVGRVEVARAEFLARHRAALADFFADYLRAWRWFLDPANRTQAIAAVAAFNHEPPAAFAYLFSARDYHRDRDARPDLALLQRNLALLGEAGVVATNIDVRRYADLSFIDAAAERLPRARLRAPGDRP